MACKGRCDEYKNHRPFGSPYKKGYLYCRVCDVWFLKNFTKPHERFGYVCSCCNVRPKSKSYRKLGKILIETKPNRI